MKILLTGADGFTGRHFLSHIGSTGWDVVPLVADLTDSRAIAEEVVRVQPDRVLHLAAISFVQHANVQAFYDVNLIGTLNLLDGLKALKRPSLRVLLASSANIYGVTPVSPISESQPPAPANHYAMSKLGMELMARNYLDEFNIVFARPFNYTGPGHAEQFVIPKLIQHFSRRASHVELGNIEVEREFNDVRFVTEAYVRFLERGKAGETYNICTGRPFTLTYVISELARLTGHRIEVRFNKAFARANEVPRLCGNPSKLINAIGQLPVPALEDTLQWMLDAVSGGGPS